MKGHCIGQIPAKASLIALSAQAVEEFQSLYQKKFGKVLSDEEATSEALKLLRFFQLIYRPLPFQQGAIDKATDNNENRH